METCIRSRCRLSQQEWTARPQVRKTRTRRPGGSHQVARQVFILVEKLLVTSVKRLIYNSYLSERKDLFLGISKALSGFKLQCLATSPLGGPGAKRRALSHREQVQGVHSGGLSPHSQWGPNHHSINSCCRPARGASAGSPRGSWGASCENRVCLHVCWLSGRPQPVTPNHTGSLPSRLCEQTHLGTLLHNSERPTCETHFSFKAILPS